MTYTGVLATIFTGIEPAVALSLACVPFLRPLIRGAHKAGSGSDSQYASSALRSEGPSGVGGAGSRAFKELHDDSSEIQLRPLGGSDSLKYEAEVGHGQAVTPPPAESAAGAILVKKDWDVVSGTRPDT